jgi:hypothetical protein
MSKKDRRAGINRRRFMKVSAAAVGGVASLARLGEARAEDQLEPIEPFSIEIPDIVLNDLRT